MHDKSISIYNISGLWSPFSFADHHQEWALVPCRRTQTLLGQPPLPRGKGRTVTVGFALYNLLFANRNHAGNWFNLWAELYWYPHTVSLRWETWQLRQFTFIKHPGCPLQPGLHLGSTCFVSMNFEHQEEDQYLENSPVSSNLRKLLLCGSYRFYLTFGLIFL